LLLLLRLLWSYKNPTHRRTGRQAAKPKVLFSEQEQKNRKHFNKEKRNPQNKKQRTSRSPTKHIYCKLFVSWSNRQKKQAQKYFLPFVAFLPSLTCFCLLSTLVIFLSFHRRSFCGVPARTSSTNDDPSVTNSDGNPRPSNKTAKHTHNDKRIPAGRQCTVLTQQTRCGRGGTLTTYTGTGRR
jgi:hypothetical protein